MANLKDTIVLGNLTVTGSVVASDILVSGTGNEFESIKVNKIMAKNEPWSYFEYGSDYHDEEGDPDEIHLGWMTADDDEYGCIFPKMHNYGFIGTPNKTYYYGYFTNTVTQSLFPLGTTAQVGSSAKPFPNIYGATITTTNTYADTLYTKKIRARNGASTGTSSAVGYIQMEPSTYGWKLSGDSNISTAYSASIYPSTNGNGRIGQDYYHFGMSWINYMCVYTLYPMNTSDTTYGADKGRIGTSSYYFNAGYIKTIYRTTESSLSDVRLKTNITNSTLNALNVINQLDIIDFKYLSDQKSDMRLQKERSKAISTMKVLEKTAETKELRKKLQQVISAPNNSKATTIGISAQQLESLLPSQYRKTFITKESTEHYSDQYYLKENRLVYLAMKAIQEQQAIIDKLQARIEVLEQGDK
jgi:hypothetical protein